MKIGFFSTDFSSQPIVDKEKSAINHRTEFVKDKTQLAFGGTFWYRGGMPATELMKHDYECVIAWRFRQLQDGTISVLDVAGNWHDDCDVIWQQRWMHRDAAEQFKRARAVGQYVISDLDDNFWKLSKTNIAHETTDAKNNPDFNRDHYRNGLAASSAITVSTPSLGKEIEHLGVPVYLCRNMIDIERWPQLDPTSDGMIGWVGGVQWRSHDLEQLRTNRIPEFLEAWGLPFYHGGDSNVPGVRKAYEIAGIDKTRVQCTVAPLVSIQEYPRLWEPVNVSLIPLEDVPFNRGKSSLKALESSACGIPYIASDHPEQRWFTEHGGMGRLARNTKPQQWLDHLTDLLDPIVRKEEGQANREHAEQFDIRDNWSQWADVFNEVVA